MPHRNTNRAPAVSGAIFALLAFAAAADLAAHAVDHRVERDAGVVVALSYAGAGPVSGAEYRVYGPEPGPPFATGRSARDGTLAFRPDAEGTWRVIVADEGGHGAVIPIEVGGGSAAPAATGPAAMPRWSRVLAGVGYVFGLAGALALWRARR